MPNVAVKQSIIMLYYPNKFSHSPGCGPKSTLTVYTNTIDFSSRK